MPVADLPVAFDEARIAAYCRDRGIKRLRLFGSVLRDDFVPGVSDVDVLADFQPGALEGVGWNFFTYNLQLEEIFGAKVDLLVPEMLSKYYREEVLSEALTIYEQA